MNFLVRILGVLGVVIAVLIALAILGAIVLGVLYFTSRGLQTFLRLFGKEVGSMFDWMFGGILKKMGFEKKKK